MTLIQNALFLQSDVQDPYVIYAEMRASTPVYWDELNGIWAVYSYAACKAILDNSNAFIPPYPPTFLKSNLVRLSNPPEHAITREVANQVFHLLKPASIPDLLQELLAGNTSIEWVNTVCKKLPVLSLLRGFGFSPADETYVLNHIADLIKIMQPSVPDQALTDIVDRIYQIAEKYAHTKDPIHISNLIGMFIQSYEAGRGILSNTLLECLKHKVTTNFPAAVTETFRFDAPNHHTRRVLKEDMFLEDRHLKKGDTVVIVLAAANHDPLVFEAPDTFDLNRPNNNAFLTFGSGAHACIAYHYAAHMAVNAMNYLFSRYKINLVDQAISYEPVFHARLPEEIHLQLS